MGVQRSECQGGGRELEGGVLTCCALALFEGGGPLLRQIDAGIALGQAADWSLWSGFGLHRESQLPRMVPRAESVQRWRGNFIDSSHNMGVPV